MPGLENLDLCAYSFLIEHPTSGRKLILDLGFPKDWGNLATICSEMERSGGIKVIVEKNVSEILIEGGIRLGDIEAVIWR